MSKHKKFLIFFSCTIFLFGSFSASSTDIKVPSAQEKAEQALKDKDYEKAADYYRQLVILYSDNYAYRLKYAYALYMLQDYATAKDEFLIVFNKSGNEKMVAYSMKMLAKIREVAPAVFQQVVRITPQQQQAKTTTSNHQMVQLKNSRQEHYLCNRRDPTILKGGEFRRWEKEDMPIKVYIPSPPSKYAPQNPQNYVKWVRESMELWSTASGGAIKFRFLNIPSDENITINWLEYFPDDSTWGLAALPQYDPKKDKRVSFVFLAVKAQPGSAMFTANAAQFSKSEFMRAATHEIGHALGLSHSYPNEYNKDIMMPFFQANLATEKVTFTDRDLNSLKILYNFPTDSLVKCVN